jgi:hypothetical protein
LALTATVAGSVGVGVGVGVAGASSQARPSPGNYIVGKSISLPPALFEANPVGSKTSGILLTSSQSRDVEKAMWRLWETAQVDSDTRALSQLMSPGQVLEGIINKCADPDGKCVEETKPRPLESLTTIVPFQSQYPIYFLSEVRTTNYVGSATSGIENWEPWIELQILTKNSPSSSWKISFDSGLDDADETPPALLPFDLGRTPDGTELNMVPFHSPPQPADQYLPQLASYWQSFVDVGQAPDNSAFVGDGYTSGVGQSLAQYPQGSTYVGHQQNFSFASTPSDPSWTFSASGGYPLVCGTVDETETDTTSPSTPMYQNPDESNYGTPLAPGYYDQITSDDARETCVYVVAGGLDAVGDNQYGYATTGTSVTVAVGPGGSTSSSEASSTVSDLETVYGVLGDQVTQYATQLETCANKSATACTTAYATSASQQFARFSNSLTGLDFPNQLNGQVDALNSSAVRVSRLLAELESSTGNPHLLAAGVVNAITVFQQDYAQLIDDLSQ